VKKGGNWVFLMSTSAVGFASGVAGLSGRGCFSEQSHIIGDNKTRSQGGKEPYGAAEQKASKVKKGATKKAKSQKKKRRNKRP